MALARKIQHRKLKKKKKRSGSSKEALHLNSSSVCISSRGLDVPLFWKSFWKSFWKRWSPRIFRTGDLTFLPQSLAGTGRSARHQGRCSCRSWSTWGSSPHSHKLCKVIFDIWVKKKAAAVIWTVLVPGCLWAEAGEQGIAQNSDLRFPQYVLPNLFILMNLIFPFPSIYW